MNFRPIGQDEKQSKRQLWTSQVLLGPRPIRLAGKVTSKKRLFLILGEIAHSAYDLSAEDTVDALLERENLGPTAVGHGVALPHARLEGLDRVVGAFIRLEKPC